MSSKTRCSSAHPGKFSNHVSSNPQDLKEADRSLVASKWTGRETVGSLQIDSSGHPHSHPAIREIVQIFRCDLNSELSVKEAEGAGWRAERGQERGEFDDVGLEHDGTARIRWSSERAPLPCVALQILFPDTCSAATTLCLLYLQRKQSKRKEKGCHSHAHRLSLLPPSVQRNAHSFSPIWFLFFSFLLAHALMKQNCETGSGLRCNLLCDFSMFMYFLTYPVKHLHVGAGLA